MRRAIVVVAAALLLRASLACAAPASRGLDCSPAPFPSRSPDVFELALETMRDAASGDGAAQWLLGSLYLFGLGVPKDHDTGIKWIETATRTLVPTIRAAIAPGTLSDMEFFSMMLGVAQEVIPELTRRYGVTWGVALYGRQSKTVLQALIGCH
jgi:hypothetical protein